MTIFYWTKLKAFADHKLNIVKMIILLLGRIESIVGKGENAGYQHFLLFPQCFQKVSSSGSLKVGIVWERMKDYIYLTHICLSVNLCNLHKDGVFEIR